MKPPKANLMDQMGGNTVEGGGDESGGDDAGYEKNEASNRPTAPLTGDAPSCLPKVGWSPAVTSVSEEAVEDGKVAIAEVEGGALDGGAPEGGEAAPAGQKGGVERKVLPYPDETPSPSPPPSASAPFSRPVVSPRPPSPLPSGEVIQKPNLLKWLSGLITPTGEVKEF